MTSRFNLFHLTSQPLTLLKKNCLNVEIDGHSDIKKNILQKLVYMIPALTVEQNQNSEGAASSG